jgi:protein SCO1/2
MSDAAASFLAGPPTRASFALVDHNDHPVTESDYRGQFMLIYFGFTHCRAVCPRALTRLSLALAELGPKAGQIRALYISVDPDRDTPAVMKEYLEEKFPRFTGLTGTRAQTDAAKAAFRVFAERRDDASQPDGYSVPHSALTYLVGPGGDYLVHFPDTVDHAALAQRLGTFLA